MSLPPPVPGYERVSIAQLHANPERWDGQAIEVYGFAVREFENSNLYPSYGAYCGGSGGGYASAVGVEWPDELSTPLPYNRSYVLLRGTFENTRYGRRPDLDTDEGIVIVIANSWSFGPIRDIEIAAVLSDLKPTCSSAPMDQEGWRPPPHGADRYRSDKDLDEWDGDLARRDAQIVLFAPPCPESEDEMRERHLMPFLSETEFENERPTVDEMVRDIENSVTEMERLIEVCGDDEECIAREDAVDYCLRPLE